MNDRNRVAGALLSVLWAQATCAATTEDPRAAAAAPVQVVYVHPEKFTDVGDRYLASDEARRVYLSELEQYIARQAGSILKGNERLVVRISDIDRAGAFEPWYSRSENVRVIRDVYPPRIDLSFTLTGADGVVLKTGERKLRDPSFLLTAIGHRSDPLRYEKKLLDDWLRRELTSG